MDQAAQLSHKASQWTYSAATGVVSAASDRFEADVVDRVTPGVSVAAKRTPQSTAPAAVEARLAEVRRWLDGLGELC